MKLGGVNETWTAKRTVRAALATTVAASAAPYGYTVTMWSVGAIVIRAHGLPAVGEVFAFAAGALCGFRLMGLLARGALSSMESLGDAAERVSAGALSWFAVGTAVGVVALISEIHGWEVWPLSSFTATALYVLLASLQLAVVSARHNS